MAKKSRDAIFENVLALKFCYHQRVGIIKFLKSLLPMYYCTYVRGFVTWQAMPRHDAQAHRHNACAASPMGIAAGGGGVSDQLAVANAVGIAGTHWERGHNGVL
jgi:hypothetical protein